MTDQTTNSERQVVRPVRRKVLKSSRWVQVSHAPYTLYLDCGHVIGSSRIGKTAGCRQCARSSK